MSAALDERLRLAFPPRRALTVKGAEPGATITFTDGGQTRTGVVVDRAALVSFRTVAVYGGRFGNQSAATREVAEDVAGTYLWVIPDTGDTDRGGCVMVQTWQSQRRGLHLLCRLLLGRRRQVHLPRLQRLSRSWLIPPANLTSRPLPINASPGVGRGRFVFVGF